MKRIWVHCPDHPVRPNGNHPLCQIAASVNWQQIRLVPAYQRKDIPLSWWEKMAATGRWT